MFRILINVCELDNYNLQLVAVKDSRLEELASVLEYKSYAVPLCPEVEVGTPVEVKRDICYIVAGVCIQGGKVLLMQEAKESCRGMWYLPAGRMEPGESIEQGCVREVLEETGLQVQPMSLIMVEAGGGRWMRFTFYCRAVGGDLKSGERADKESLQAGWFDLKSYSVKLSLRAVDIIPLIDCAQKWLLDGDKLEYLPLPTPYKFFVIRLVCVSKLGEIAQVLLNENRCLPVLQVPPAGKIKQNVCEIVRKILKEEKANPKIVGVAGVDHTGGDRDGVCLTLASVLEEYVPHAAWYPVVEKEMRKKVDRLICKAIPLDIYYD